MNIQTIEGRLRDGKQISNAERHFLLSKLGSQELVGWVQTYESEWLPSDLCHHYNPSENPKIHHWTRKSTAVFDPIVNLHCSNCICDTLYFIAKEGGSAEVHKLPSYHAPLFSKFQVSRKGFIYSDKSLPLHEHSGAGTGSAKNFTKPEGESFGIEVETMFRSANPTQSLKNKILFSLWLKDNYPEWIVERDGSLEDGLNKANLSDFVHCCAEIVSPPMKLDDLNPALSRIVAKLAEFKASSQRIGDFFAIHITSNIYNPKCIPKLIRTVNDNRYRHFWLRASFRPQSDGFVGNYGKAYCKFDEISISASDYDICNMAMDGHYRALYIRSGATAAELRIFQTRINTRYILDILELTSLLSKFCHSNEPDWLDFVVNNASDSLKRYLEAVKAFDTKREYDFKK